MNIDGLQPLYIFSILMDLDLKLFEDKIFSEINDNNQETLFEIIKNFKPEIKKIEEFSKTDNENIKEVTRILKESTKYFQSLNGKAHNPSPEIKEFCTKQKKYYPCALKAR